MYNYMILLCFQYSVSVFSRVVLDFSYQKTLKKEITILHVLNTYLDKGMGSEFIVRTIPLLHRGFYFIKIDWNGGGLNIFTRKGGKAKWGVCLKMGVAILYWRGLFFF